MTNTRDLNDIDNISDTPTLNHLLNLPLINLFFNFKN